MKFTIGLFFIAFTSGLGLSQIPLPILIKIVKAEDRRAYDKTLQSFMTGGSPAVQVRAELAAGRIGDKNSIPTLVALLEKGGPAEVRAMAAFAIGEIESIDGAQAILNALNDSSTDDTTRARAVEAAGKIAAANAKEPKSKELGNVIISTLESEYANAAKLSRETVLLGLTALLRVRPNGAEVTTAKFLSSSDAQVRATAGNTMTRIKAKNANPTLSKMLISDPDPIARANAARALGAAEEKDALEILITAASTDGDSRVRVSAIRSLAAIKGSKAAEALLKRGEDLLALYTKAKRRNFIPTEQNELIEIAVALGRLYANTDNRRADQLLADLGKLDKGQTPEIYIARVRIGPKRGEGTTPEMTDWRQFSALAQIVGEFAVIEPTSVIGKQMKAESPGIIRPLAKAFAEADPASEGKRMMAGPDALQAFARFKTDDLAEVSRTALRNKDVQMRATAASIMGDLPSLNEDVEALKIAFNYALLNDMHDNDAQLAILDALYKLDKRVSVGPLLIALNAPDYLVRKKAFDLLADKQLQRVFPDIPTSLERARVKHKDEVLPYSPAFGTKLGQVLNTDADYRRALMRKNGSVKAVLTTEKGTFTIVFNPEEAPLTVDNFIKLAHSGYFNGLQIHRVVPNFVMQDGDPRGDGNGGPGWSIRCEINMLPYDRGAVGMALSGKDSGGSQWFVTHSPQPHLDGGYTVFGHVNEMEMNVVDNIVRGDKILSVKIVELPPQRAQIRDRNRFVK
ncbi:MAG: peptidylprolyl isomerase [Acidobacteriota bacterium]